MNIDSSKAQNNIISVSLNKSLNEGGLQLNSSKQYYVYDFWNDHFIGLINGSDKLEQQLRVGEARMMSIHAKENHPQFISTNRHIMQGYVDLKNVMWNEKNKMLSGDADVVADDTYTIVIATNGYKFNRIKINSGNALISKMDKANGLIYLTISSSQNREVVWSVSFK